MKNYSKRLRGKVVLISGSSRGIGKKIALLFCQCGAKVVLNGRNPARLAETFNEFISQGFEVAQYSADVSTIRDCQQLVSFTKNQFGRIDVLINNGSSSMEDYFEDLAPEVYREVFISNSVGAALPTLAALPELKKSKGSIIFMSSIAGFGGAPKASAYCAGKMSLTALAQSLRMELQPKGIHVGICYVGLAQNDSDKTVLDARGSLKSVGKRPAFLQQPQEKVAHAVLRMVDKRQSRKVLSTFGKFVAMMSIRFPHFTTRMMIIAEKRKQKQTQALTTTKQTDLTGN